MTTSLPTTVHCSLFTVHFLLPLDQVEIDLSLLHFADGNHRGLVTVWLDARHRAPLQLLAPLRGNDDEAIGAVQLPGLLKGFRHENFLLRSRNSSRFRGDA